MAVSTELLLGIDVGTQGARVLVTDATGNVVAMGTKAFTELALPGRPEGHLEQEPEMWWQAVSESLCAVIQQLRDAGRSANEIVAGAVDSTSGTIVLLDTAYRPIRPALMYNDRRAGKEADEINGLAGEFCEKVGYRFNSSFALPKILWLSRHESENWSATHLVVHAADYIVGRLTGEFHVSDQSNALKTGFDLVDMQWPRWIERDLDISTNQLPRIVFSGQGIANVSAHCAVETGLATATRIVAGMTDGSADQIGSGAHQPGDWNTVLGTTITLKGLTRNLVKDPLGRVYCHRHPQGYWMPGGASNVGARVLDERFPGVDKGEMGRLSLQASPTGMTVYPLSQSGERFPFVRPDAMGFQRGEANHESERYAAHLEGIAFTERLAYDVVQELGAEVGRRVYTTGGGAKSPEWMQIRADILERELARAKNASAALGCAILAASNTLYADVTSAAAAMTRVDLVVSPRDEMVHRYQEAYDRFREALQQRGYI